MADYLVIKGRCTKGGKRFSFAYYCHERDSEVTPEEVRRMSACWALDSKGYRVQSLEPSQYVERPSDYDKCRLHLHAEP